MELLTVIKCPAARGRGVARPNPSIIGARSPWVSCMCTPDVYLYALCVPPCIAPRVLHFSAVHSWLSVGTDARSVILQSILHTSMF